MHRVGSAHAWSRYSDLCSRGSILVISVQYPVYYSCASAWYSTLGLTVPVSVFKSAAWSFRNPLPDYIGSMLVFLLSHWHLFIDFTFSCSARGDCSKFHYVLILFQILQRSVFRQPCLPHPAGRTSFIVAAIM